MIRPIDPVKLQRLVEEFEAQLPQNLYSVQVEGRCRFIFAPSRGHAKQKVLRELGIRGSNFRITIKCIQ